MEQRRKQSDEIEHRGEQYIIDESQEISIGQSLLLEKFFSAFPAFKHRNYQLYFSGQLISMIGVWLQRVAQGWLVLQITQSAFWVGTVAALGLLPVLLFSLPGGVIVDRFRKKHVLYATQFFSMVLAFILGMLTLSNMANTVNISVLAFLLGLIDAIDKPARQSFAIEMVGKEDLQSAIALNSGIFNGARVIGPAIAGFTIGLYGTEWAFIVNAISYLPIILAMYYIRVHEIIPDEHPHPLRAIIEGIRFSFSHVAIRDLLVFSGFVSVFGWSHVTILPVIAQRSFNLDATGLGYLFAASGAGAVVGTVLISSLAKKIAPMTFITVGTLLYVLSIILFTVTTSLPIALSLLFLSGMGLLMQFSVINSMIQHAVPDYIRGRVMSMYVLMAIGTSPIGSFQIGLLSEYFGTGIALSAGAVILALSGLFLYLRRENLQFAR